MTQLQTQALLPAFEQLCFFGERLPDTSSEALQNAFAQIAEYRNGGIYIGHYAGLSEWERHPQGDEIVMLLEGETTLYVLQEGQENAFSLKALELMVVPAGLWHRFETPQAVKVLTVTPQPTDHSLERPDT